MWQSNRMLHSATYQCNASKYRDRRLIYGRSLGLSLYPEERRLPESTSRCDVGRKNKKIMNWFWIERAILHFPHSTVSALQRLPIHLSPAISPSYAGYPWVVRYP